MMKLLLKFETRMLKEVLVGGKPIMIGRSPDNDFQIDNLAVSTHHARVFYEDIQLIIEDLDSLNGTFVNNQRIKRTALRHGDTVTIGKHQIVVQRTGDMDVPLPEEPQARASVPKVEETVVLATKRQREMIEQVARPAEAAPAPAPGRARLGSLVVLSGKTDQTTYQLSSKLTVIGKSKMATVRLKGWFAPKAAAQINKREDGYYIGRADRIPKVNGEPAIRLTKLHDGDLIEVAGVRFNFVYPE